MKIKLPLYRNQDLNELAREIELEISRGLARTLLYVAYEQSLPDLVEGEK